MNVLHTEPDSVMHAIARLIVAHDEARAAKLSSIRTLVIIAVADEDTHGRAILTGCDTSECRAAAVALAETISDIPRMSIN